MWGSAVRVCPGLRRSAGGDWLSWLEHRLCKPGVVGSSPTFSTEAGDSREAVREDGSLTGWEREESETRSRAARRAPRKTQQHRARRPVRCHWMAVTGGAGKTACEKLQRKSTRGRGQRCPAASERQRAHGGCLGSQGRRRARQAAKGRGEARAAMDPRMPEWGNPPREGAASA